MDAWKNLTVHNPNLVFSLCLLSNLFSVILCFGDRCLVVPLKPTPITNFFFLVTIVFQFSSSLDCFVLVWTLLGEKRFRPGIGLTSQIWARVWILWSYWCRFQFDNGVAWPRTLKTSSFISRSVSFLPIPLCLRFL